ncbi:MAG: HAD family hydrolase [Candidatus Bathyarchaeia archaeon]
MGGTEALVFDFIGTLTTLVDYSKMRQQQDMKLYETLVKAGFDMKYEAFFESYEKAFNKYREIRFQKLVEISNPVWVSEALVGLGYSAEPEDEAVKAAVNAFFEDYLKALRLRPHARSMLHSFQREMKLGLISNFTYSPLIYAGLRKMSINDVFQAVVVSEAVGWRKPSARIFQEALEMLQVKAENAIYVGDSPLEDIQGAKNAGFRAVFIQSQFNTLKDMKNATQQPDFYIKKLTDLTEIMCRT